MPAKPPASLVPAIDEESPKRDADPSSDSNQQSAQLPAPLPPDSQAPATDRSGAAPSSDRRRAASVAEAPAARSASIAQQEEFTRRLAAAVVAEHDPAIRSLIVETAAGLQTPSAVAICRGAVVDPDAQVRMAACNAWMRRGGEDALQVLSQRYREDEDLGVRLRALRALGALKDKAAIPVVVTALDDPDPAVQTRAVQVLKQLTGRDLGTDPQTWRTWAANPDGKPWWNIAEALRSMF
ncbi:MAG: HEAT repeat domain-containing protein [Planctomycetia bacterium]